MGLRQTFNNIATAIQEKLGTNTPIAAGDMATKISEIQTGCPVISNLVPDSNYIFDLKVLKEILIKYNVDLDTDVDLSDDYIAFGLRPQSGYGYSMESIYLTVYNDSGNGSLSISGFGYTDESTSLGEGVQTWNDLFDYLEAHGQTTMSYHFSGLYDGNTLFPILIISLHGSEESGVSKVIPITADEFNKLTYRA